MIRRRLPALLSLLAAQACTLEKVRVAPPRDSEVVSPKMAPQDLPRDASSPPRASETSVDRAHLDDGDDDLDTESKVDLPLRAHFEKVGQAPLALKRICDLTVFHGKLYAAHANQPLGTDGATISVYDPRDTEKPFRVAFDWNRPGEPDKGGGAGQGFLRVHRVVDDPSKKDGARLYVPDADPPYAGFGIADRGTEGFVFVSDHDGMLRKRVRPATGPLHLRREKGLPVHRCCRAPTTLSTPFDGEMPRGHRRVRFHPPRWHGEAPHRARSIG